MLLFHHSMDLDEVVLGEIQGNPNFSDPEFKNAYLWLEREVGFYPLFLAVGGTEDDIRMTGYQDNWRIRTSYTYVNGKIKGHYRKAGEFPNVILFSFEDIDGIFMDYDYWHLVLNSSNKNITDYEKRLIFKPSWTKAKWLRKSSEYPHSVQLVTSKVVLPKAARIYVKNKKTKKSLENIGFSNVDVKRITLE